MASQSLESQYRPRLREIKFGPPQKYGDKVSFFLKDTYTRQYFRIGEREHFLLSRMDGTQTIAELGSAYTVRFGKRMAPESWAQIFSLARSRNLLDDADAAQLEKMREEAQARSRTSSGLLTRRFPLVNPDRYLDWILPWVRWSFTIPFLLIGMGTVIATEIFILPQMKTILSAAWAARHGTNPAIWPLLFAVIFITTVFHETAHGLTLRHFGGNVLEMGMIFRYGAFFPYTRVDDVVLLPKRQQQIAVAFAGTFMSLLAIVPFAVTWMLGPSGNLKSLTALMLTSYHFAALMNLLPFVQLDGYHMLAFLVGRPLLRVDARKYTWQRILQLLHIRQKQPDALSGTERVSLIVYGVFAAIGTAAFAALIAFWWHRWLAYSLGSKWAWVAVVVLLVTSLVGRKAYRFLQEKARRWIQSDQPGAEVSMVVSGGEK